MQPGLRPSAIKPGSEMDPVHLYDFVCQLRHLCIHPKKVASLCWEGRLCFPALIFSGHTAPLPHIQTELEIAKTDNSVASVTANLAVWKKLEQLEVRVL